MYVLSSSTSFSLVIPVSVEIIWATNITFSSVNQSGCSNDSCILECLRHIFENNIIKLFSVKMDYLTLSTRLLRDYPYLIILNRNTYIASNLKEAFKYVDYYKPKKQLTIDLSFENITKFPCVVWDYNNSRAIIKSTTIEDLEPFIDNKEEKEFIICINITINPNVLELKLYFGLYTLNMLDVELGSKIKLDNGDHVTTLRCKGSEYYCFYIITRASNNNKEFDRIKSECSYYKGPDDHQSIYYNMTFEEYKADKRKLKTCHISSASYSTLICSSCRQNHRVYES